MKDDVIQRLSRAAARGEASRIGTEIARFITRLSPREPDGVIAAAYLAGAVTEDSHTCLCLDTSSLASTALEKGLEPRDLEALPRDLPQSEMVGRPGETAPLILDGDRLYLHRYWSYEQRLASRLLTMARQSPKPPDILLASKMTDSLFPSGPAKPDWQKIAAFNALFRRLLVISGGPGTGKTRTVTALMALLLACDKAGELRIAMCAPTGKAAARLTESVTSSMNSLDLPREIRRKMPLRAQTLHRLLGYGKIPGLFRFNRENPLPCNLLILDEASMVDLPMMVHLTDALRDEAGLVLLGDRDQLASVDAGSVLNDLCRGVDMFTHSRSFIELAGRINENLLVPESGLASPPPLRDGIITLSHNYRFCPGSGIMELSSAVNHGDFHRAKRILEDRALEKVRFIPASRMDIGAFLEREALPGFRHLMQAVTPEDALGKMDDLKILCGLKRGFSGQGLINSHVSTMLNKGRPRLAAALFKGLPIIITRNDYMLELFNGDTGIIWPDESGSMKAWFPTGKDEARRFSPARLPAFQAAWAITVHRSQGSEFRKVLLVLPSEKSAMPGRELLYTAITRAREEIVIWGAWNDLKACIKNRTARASGLGDILWRAKQDR